MDADWLWKTLEEVQTQYKQDKKRWKDELHQERKTKKHLEKELKHNMQERLEYLENQASLVQSYSNSSVNSTASASMPSMNGVEVTFHPSDMPESEPVMLTKETQDQLMEIASQIKDKHEKQTAKLREKLQVTEELLSLLDDQHQAEINELKLDYEDKFQKLDSENSDLHNQLLQVTQQQANSKREIESLRSQLEILMSEKPLHFTHFSPSSSPDDSHYDEQLDRAIAERDLAIQDAMRYWNKCTKDIADLRAEHVRELDKVHGQCRAEFQELLDQTKAKHQEELQSYFKEISILKTSKDEGRDPKYMACLQKRQDLTQKVKQLESQATTQRHEWKLSIESTRAKAKKETDALNEKIQLLEKELESRNDFSIREKLEQQRHSLDREWREEWQKREKGWNEQIEALREKHRADLEHKDVVAQKTIQENSLLNKKITEVTAKLNVYEELLEQEKQERSMLEAEKQRLEDDLVWERSVKEDLRKRQSGSMEGQQIYQVLNNHQASITSTMEDLRKDVLVLRSTIESSKQTSEVIEKANFEDVKDHLANIHESLNEALAELTLETEAMMVCRDELLKNSSDFQSHQEFLANAFKNINEYVASDKVRVELAQQLKRKEDELSELRKMTKTTEEPSNSPKNDIDQIRMEILNQLRNKEEELKDARKVLQQLQEDLRTEISRRERCEAEADRLRDQAEAYSEEMMQLESSKVTLEEKLRNADKKLEAALLRINMAEHQKHEPLSAPQSPVSPVKRDDTNAIDDALELARNFGNTIHGRAGDNEKSVIEMLESLSDLMDQHDKGQSNDSAETPPHRHESVQHGFDGIEVTARGIPSPLESLHSSQTPSAIELVVAQLYSKCQMLERERSELIHSTMDLLEAARESSQAEINAALATAHRQTIEDLTELNRRNKEQQYKMHEKMCHQCRSTLLANGK